MSQSFARRSWRLICLATLLVLTLSLVMVGGAGAEGGPHPQVLDYPKIGCYDVVTAGIGMFSGNSLYPIKMRVPGPVVDAYLVWIGTEDISAPNTPNQSDLTVVYTNTLGSNASIPVIGDRKDSKSFAGSSTWYMWRADIGPNGKNIVRQDYNEFMLKGWTGVPSDVRRNGASVVVVYSTGACSRPNQVDLIDNMDWYWERTGGEGTTTPQTFTFPPAPVNRTVTVWLNHAGTDNYYPCRPENTWVATGTGTPPASIIDWGAVGDPSQAKGINGGVLGIQNSFVAPTCPQARVVHAPVIDVDGGFIDPQWSVDKATINVPAGATWLVLQAESVRTGAPDHNATGESGAWFMQASVPVFNPELRIAKTDGVTNANPGQNLTYAINYDNHGNGPAYNTMITDTLPARATFVSATNGGVLNGNNVIWNVGTLNNGANGAVQVTVKLDPVFPAGTTVLTNTVKIGTDTPGEKDLSDNTATDTTSVFAKVELDIKKSAAPEPVDAGGNLTYTVDWTVGGNAFAPGVAIVDSLPMSVTFVSASNGGVYNPATHRVTWTLTPDPTTPVKTGSYTINVKVKSPLYNGTKFTNNVTIADTIGDSKSASATSTVRSSHVLQVAKTASPEPVEAGANLAYSLTWSVTGNEPAPNAIVVDTLPKDVTFVSASNGGVYDPVAHKVTWSLGEIMTPQTGNLSVIVQVKSPLYSGTPLTNVVVFDDSSSTPPAEATVISTVHSDHLFVIEKADGPDPVMKGAQLFYTITWSLQGNEPADNVVISDSLPFGTKFVSATAGGVYNPGTGAVIWNLGNLLTPKSGVVSFVVTVNKDFPNGPDILNTVTISDSKPGKEKSATARTAVIQTPQGSIGDTVWFDVNRNGIQEPGESGIGGVGLILYSVGPDGQCNTADDVALGNTVTDANGHYLFNQLAAGKYCVKVIDSTVPANLTITHTPAMPVDLGEAQAYRTADFGYGPSGANGIIGDLVWSDTNGNGTFDPGETGIGNVTLDLIGAGADGLCGTADDSVVGTTTTKPDGSYLFTNVLPGKYCVRVTDTHGVLAGLAQTGGTNPHGPITLASGGTYLNADFGYRGLTGQIGNLVFYDANRNGVYEPASGEQGISGVTLNLVGPGPDGVFGTADDVVLASTSTDANGAYLFTGLPAGKYQVVVTDLAGRLLGYTQTYGVPDTNDNGQVSPYTVDLPAGGSVLHADFAYADGHLLTITKTNNQPSGVVEAGAQMIYTIGYSVSGRETAPNVRIYDTLPLQLDFVSASNGGTYDPATRLVTWSLGNLNAGTSGTVTLTVHVKKPLINNSYIFNTVTIIDDAKVTDEATDIIRVHAEPILELTKTNAPTGQVNPGDTIHYTLCYSNTGNGNATNVVLTDIVPVRTTYVAGSATGGGTFNNGILTWDLGTLAPDAAACVGFDATVNMTQPGVGETVLALTVDNTAHLDSAVLPRITRSVSNPLNAFVRPILTKVNDPTGEVLPGSTIKYTLCYRNDGNVNLTGVVLTDRLPVNASYIAGSAVGVPAPVYDEANNTLTWMLGTVGPAANGCFSFNAKVSMTISGLTGQAVKALSFAEWNSIIDLVNTATLATDQVAPKNAETHNPLNATVDLAIIKTVSNAGYKWVQPSPSP